MTEVDQAMETLERIGIGRQHLLALAGNPEAVLRARDLTGKLAGLLDETALCAGELKALLYQSGHFDYRHEKPTAVELFMGFLFIGCPMPFVLIADWNHQKRQAALNWLRQVYTAQEKNTTLPTPPLFLRPYLTIRQESNKGEGVEKEEVKNGS